MKDYILDDDIRLPREQNAQSAKEIIRLKRSYSELHPKVTNGRKAIWWLVGLQVLGMIVESVQYNFEFWIVAINAVVVGIYVAAGIVAIKKPKIGFIIVLILLSLMQILMFIGDPLSAIKGILWRGIIAYFVIVGLSAVNEYFKVLRGLKEYDIKVEGSELV